MRRASALPFARYCGHASVLAEKHPETSEAAECGTDDHAQIAAGITCEAEPTSDADKAAVSWVRHLARELGPDVKLSVEEELLLLDDEAHDYEPLSTGHCDLSIDTPSILHVVDWKRSKWGNVEDPNTNPQPITYGLAKTQKEPKPFQVHLVFGDESEESGEVHPRSSRVFTVEERLGLLSMVRELSTKSEDPCPGKHCSRCYVSQYCQAYRARTISALAVLGTDSTSLDQHLAEELDHKLQLAEQWIEWAKQLRTGYVKAGGVLIREGKQAHVIEQAGRETADCKQLRADGLEKYIKTGAPFEKITWRKVKG